MLVYYFVAFIVSNRYLLFRDSNGHNSVTVQNRTHVYMNFFDHKDVGNHLLQLYTKYSGLHMKCLLFFSDFMHAWIFNKFTADTVISLLNVVALWLKHTEDLNNTVSGAIHDKLNKAILFSLNVTQLYSTSVNVILVMAIRKVWLSLQWFHGKHRHWAVFCTGIL